MERLEKLNIVIDKRLPEGKVKEKRSRTEKPLYLMLSYASDRKQLRITPLGGWRISGLFHDSPSFGTRAASSLRRVMVTGVTGVTAVIDKGSVIRRLARFRAKQCSAL